MTGMISVSAVWVRGVRVRGDGLPYGRDDLGVLGR